MQFKSSRNKPHIYLKTLLQINNKTQQKIESAIILKDQRCVIKYQTFYLLVDLYKTRSQEEKQINLETITQIVPAGETFCCDSPYLFGGFCFFTMVDKTGNSTKIPLQNNIVHKYIHFLCSGDVFIMSMDWDHSVQLMNLKKPEQKYLFHQDQKNGITKANDDNFIFISRDQHSRHIDIMNLNTGERTTTTLPVDKNHFLNILMLGNDFKKAIFSHRSNQLDSVIEVGVASLGEQGKIQVLRQFKNCRNMRFLLLNYELELVLLSVQSSIMHEKKHLVVYNYGNDCVIWDIQPQQGINLQFRMSPNFQRFIDLKNNEEQNQVIVYDAVDVRKLYMHIGKKGGLQQIYGNQIVRYILKAIL